jgi:hypothetical protein
MNDFLTWDPLQFGELDFDKSPVPTDHNTSISSVRSYLAQAMIMWYDTSVRDKNAQAWDRLLASWKATFHSELTAGALEKWPTDGPHGFSEDQSTWLAATLRYLKGQGRASRRRVSAPPHRRPQGPFRPPNLLHGIPQEAVVAEEPPGRPATPILCSRLAGQGYIIKAIMYIMTIIPIILLIPIILIISIIRIIRII